MRRKLISVNYRTSVMSPKHNGADRLLQLRRSIAMNSQMLLTRFVLAAALALTGRMTKAGEARDAGLVLDPNFSVARYRNDRRSDNPVFLQQRERMLEGLRKACVPEGQ